MTYDLHMFVNQQRSRTGFCQGIIADIVGDALDASDNKAKWCFSLLVNGESLNVYFCFFQVEATSLTQLGILRTLRVAS